MPKKCGIVGKNNVVEAVVEVEAVEEAEEVKAGAGVEAEPTLNDRPRLNDTNSASEIIVASLMAKSQVVNLVVQMMLTKPPSNISKLIVAEYC